MAVLPSGSTPKAEATLSVKKDKLKLKKEEEAIERKPAAPKSVGLPKQTTQFAKYGSKSQKACCKKEVGSTETADWQFLDLNGDGKKGLMASVKDCEKKCREFSDPKTDKKCAFFEINPFAEVDWCTGFSSCDRQCGIKYNKPHWIFQLGLKPYKTNAQGNLIPAAEGKDGKAKSSSTSTADKEKTDEDAKKKEKAAKVDKVKMAAENSEKATVAANLANKLEDEKKV